jgi:hypothetical protein
MAKKKKGNLVGRPNVLGWIPSRTRQGKPTGIMVERDAEGPFMRLDGRRVPLPKDPGTGKAEHIFPTLVEAERAARGLGRDREWWSRHGHGNHKTPKPKFRLGDMVRLKKSDPSVRRTSKDYLGAIQRPEWDKTTEEWTYKVKHDGGGRSVFRESELAEW